MRTLFTSFVLLLCFNASFATEKNSHCQSQSSAKAALALQGTVINEDKIPIVGIFVEIALPGTQTIRTKTDNNGCFTAEFDSQKKDFPLSLDIKRREDSAVLVRAVDRCHFKGGTICHLAEIIVVSPNTVYLLPFDGTDTNQVFLSRQFRTALAKHFVNNIQELEGESVIRQLRLSKTGRKFEKLKPPALKLFKTGASGSFEVSDFEKLEKLGGDLNALALISGSTSMDERDNMLDMSSFYLVPKESTWSLDDRLDAGKLKNLVMLSRKLSPQWTYYTMIALAKRELSEALASPHKTQELKRVKAYLQAQRNQFDSRSKIKQTELLDLLCEVRLALNERCGELLVRLD
ncbi:MAG: carboxypeptidase-like regulatory domain-containing protein [Gammaproteobacteria bacterium]|nr:carboxypeptidase-like regulatory domain-containing protein [Gammaproteobacteria bacterium]MDH5728064.1 carboxypeptidase-like regulatory domain-containing protein [Gammaproteobacteria bacterium]